MARRRGGMPENNPLPVDVAKFNKGQRVWVHQAGGPSEPHGAVPGVVKRIDPTAIAVLVWGGKAHGLLTFNVRWHWQIKPREDEAHAKHQGYDVDVEFEKAAII